MGARKVVDKPNKARMKAQNLMVATFKRARERMIKNVFAHALWVQKKRKCLENRLMYGKIRKTRAACLSQSGTRLGGCNK